MGCGADSTGGTIRAWSRATHPATALRRSEQPLPCYLHNAEWTAGDCDGECDGHCTDRGRGVPGGLQLQRPARYAAQSSAGVCPASEFASSLINIPAPGTGDNDKNPQRIAPRNLFDATLGKDNIFHRDHFKINLDLTAINVTNKYALYNFLSTFSGTHYVTPRALTAKITVNF